VRIFLKVFGITKLLGFLIGASKTQLHRARRRLRLLLSKLWQRAASPHLQRTGIMFTAGIKNIAVLKNLSSGRYLPVNSRRKFGDKEKEIAAAKADPEWLSTTVDEIHTQIFGNTAIDRVSSQREKSVRMEIFQRAAIQPNSQPFAEHPFLALPDKSFDLAVRSLRFGETAKVVTGSYPRHVDLLFYCATRQSHSCLDRR
jgi:hypothetical protein